MGSFQETYNDPEVLTIKDKIEWKKIRACKIFWGYRLLAMNYVRGGSLPSNDFMSSIILQFMLVHVLFNSHTAVKKKLFRCETHCKIACFPLL